MKEKMCKLSIYTRRPELLTYRAYRIAYTT